MLRHLLLPLAALVTIALGVATADIINVPGDFAQIHDAVQAANAGDTVMVAAGTYNDCTHETEGPGSTPACVIMKAGVTLMGAGPDLTIIDAEGLGRGIFVEDADDVRIENLQVRGAFAEIYGAAILVRQGSTGAVIQDCTIRDNGDGGIIVINDSEATITRVDFLANEAKQGGGLSVEENSSATLSESLLDGNTAPSGAGMFVRAGSTVTITGTVFSNNLINAAFGVGGGVSVSSAHCDISGCEFTGNTGYGGAMAYVEATGTVENSEIIGNSTPTTGSEFNFHYGGGISCQFSAVTFRNLLVANNTAGLTGCDGGGLDIQFDPAPIVENCTFVGNSCSEDGVGAGILVQWGATAQITNCIIADNDGPGVGCYFGEAFTVTGTNIWNNSGGDDICAIDGGCNFSADPLFCNPAEDNYRIETASPCAPGNHPSGGECGASYAGAFTPGCGTPVQDLPSSALVLGNAPNPFNPMTTVFFVLDWPGDAVVRIVDLRGRTLRTFRRSGLAAGTRHEITWNGRDEQGRELPSGVYLYQLESHGQRVTERMSLIR
jgi:nitrous oxidase accessory protein NosD